MEGAILPCGDNNIGEVAKNNNLPSPSNPDVLIFSNAINMAVKGLEATLQKNNEHQSSYNEQVVSLLKNLSQQVRPSSEGTCSSKHNSPGEHTSRPNYMGGVTAESGNNSDKENEPEDFVNHSKHVNRYGSPIRETLSSPVPENKRQKLDYRDDDDKVSIHADSSDDFDQVVKDLKGGKEQKNSDDPLTQVPDSPDDFFQKYTEEFQPEVMVGPPVSEDLSRAIKIFSSTNLSSEKIKARQTRNLRPENVNLLTKLTNKSIFTLDCGEASFARATDIKLQKIQKQVEMATYPIILAMDQLKNTKSNLLSPITDKIMEGIILLTNTLQNTDQARRELYKNVLPTEWKGLITKPEGPHEELFGDVDNRLQELQTQQKLSSSLKEARDKDNKKTNRDKKPDERHKTFSSSRGRSHDGYHGYSSSTSNPSYGNNNSKNWRGFPQQRTRPSGKRGRRPRRDYYS